MHRILFRKFCLSLSGASLVDKKEEITKTEIIREPFFGNNKSRNLFSKKY